MSDNHPAKTPLNERIRKQGIYLLPNSFTTAALFGGFYAIVQAMNGKFEHAAIAIFISMVLDGLDGRVARLTHTQSDFGGEYDSLSDMVSFGVAPALVMYQWALQPLHKIGWMVAFIYAVCAALRLARFNTQIGIADKRWFTGLPSPAAAALVAGAVWISNDLALSPAEYPALRWVALVFTLFAGITMVTNVRFWSFKELGMRKSVPFFALLILVGIILFLVSYPPGVLFGMFVIYSLSGYVITAWLWLKNRKQQ
ncbi:CDP-diacylglycerol--serine O-phosphatidyltransferase [Leeia sp. TBRC 13508]|uniref:CDP-diacylglycerol--serine O-phosphatidyltransferase n=1 Tax=Leeia speluncae TaxID=2884804 RepID=A0ABS8D5P2_9NEIS|nr:CDP-diacylglycerol--serine O-phosphatidyltransferase [Leeia speluncae]MCB6183447.1 CDP-diacylglycerol--serine O-phosphatidyltransferase [Leeia speluncae]